MAFNRSSSTTNLQMIDDRDVTDQSGNQGILGDSNFVSNTTNVTDGGAIEAGRAMVEEGNDTVRFLAQMNADTTNRLGASLVNLADNEGNRSTRLIDSSMRQQGAFLDKVLAASMRTQDSAQGVINQAMTAAAAANTPMDERQQRNVLIGLGLVAAALVAVTYFGKR